MPATYIWNTILDFTQPLFESAELTGVYRHRPSIDRRCWQRHQWFNWLLHIFEDSRPKISIALQDTYSETASRHLPIGAGVSGGSTGGGLIGL